MSTRPPAVFGPVPELVSRDLEVAKEATESLGPKALGRMAMQRDLPARPVGNFELRRSLALEFARVDLQQIDQLAVLELGERRQLRDSLELDQLDAAIRRLSRLVEQIRIALEECFEVRLCLCLGQTLSGRTYFGRERDPALVLNAFGRDRDVHLLSPSDLGVFSKDIPVEESGSLLGLSSQPEPDAPGPFLPVAM